CSCKRTPGSSSRAPIGTTAMPRSWSYRGSFEPQRRQNTFLKKRASGTLYEANRSSPRTTPTPSAVVTRFEACAAPRAFRQRAQWQLRAMMGLPSTTKATPPQRQLPRGAPVSGSDGARSGSVSASTPGGYPSQVGSPSRISYHGAFEPTKMCPIGRAPGSPSNAPDGRNSLPCHGVVSSGTGEPQRSQNTRNSVGEDWKRAIRSRPRVNRKSSASHITAVENADPCALRQRPQWQWDMKSREPWVSHATSPQRQLP